MSHPRQTTRRRFLQTVAAAGAASIMLPSANRAFGFQSPNDRPAFATIGLRNQGWAITQKTFKFADFAALADVDSKVLGTNVDKTEQKQGKKPDVKKVTCGIGGISPSPVIPVVPAPEELDWESWLGPAPKVPYRALPEMRTGYGGGVPLYSNAHYSFRNWHEYSGGKLTDWGAHHVDIACWALGASDTGPSKVTPLEYTLACEYKDGHPVVDDRYNVATSFTIRAEMPNNVEMIIASEGDNGILFEGTEGRFFVNRGRIAGKPVDDLKDNPLPEGAIEEVYGGPVSENHSANFIESMKSRKQPVSDVWSHNRMLEICHLANIAMRLGREISWDPAKREIVGDAQANAFLARASRQGYEIQT